jgi:hypothetical protein
MQFCSHLLLSSAYRDYFSLSRQIKRNTFATLPGAFFEFFVLLDAREVEDDEE